MGGGGAGTGLGGLSGMRWKGGSYPPLLQGAQPMPSHYPPDGKCLLQWQL